MKILLFLRYFIFDREEKSKKERKESRKSKNCTIIVLFWAPCTRGIKKTETFYNFSFILGSKNSEKREKIVTILAL